MKIVLALAATLMSTSLAHAQIPPVQTDVAEIQIFYGYRGYSNYDFKRVSSTIAPLSAGALAEGWQTAACYKGDPNLALNLIQQMVAILNRQTGRRFAMIAGDYYFYADGKGALRVAIADEWGAPYLNFPRMIECDRWSFPAERAAY